MTDNDPKFVGDEYAEEEATSVPEEQKKLEGLYDLVLPPGIPYKLIMDAMEMFDLEVSTRKCAVKTIDVEQDNLLILRGELESVNKAHDYIFQKMSEKYNYRRGK